MTIDNFEYGLNLLLIPAIVHLRFGRNHDLNRLRFRDHDHRVEQRPQEEPSQVSTVRGEISSILVGQAWMI